MRWRKDANQKWISIHAPTRGATFIKRKVQLGKKISIHAPTRGATMYRQQDIIRYIFQSTLPREERLTGAERSSPGTEFQSTLPREERHRRQLRGLCGQDISIHAPTRGATRTRTTISQEKMYFNPRSHERSDGAIRG